MANFSSLAINIKICLNEHLSIFKLIYVIISQTWRHMEELYERNKLFIENTLSSHTNGKYNFSDFEDKFQRVYYFAGYQSNQKVFRVFGYIKKITVDENGKEKRDRKKVQIFHMMLLNDSDIRVVQSLIELCEKFEQIRMINKIKELENNIEESFELADEIMRMPIVKR